MNDDIVQGIVAAVGIAIGLFLVVAYQEWRARQVYRDWVRDREQREQTMVEKLKQARKR